MAAQQGFEIKGQFCPHNGVASLRHGDFALIREVTGLNLQDFDDGVDPSLSMLGWMAVAYWQANPQLTRDQAVRAFEQLPADSVKAVGFDDAEEDARPPEEDAAPSQSSSTDSDGPLEEPNQE